MGSVREPDGGFSVPLAFAMYYVWGKDVYLEKPCAHNVRECRAIAQAARKHGRIVQHGTMQRSGAHFQEAREYARSGKLGRIGLVRCYSILGRKSIGHRLDTKPPSHLDYDFWLGPAPERAYNENRCHYNWRFMWDYGTGDMGNWGVHWLDIPLWTLDLGWPDAVSSSGGKFIHDDDKETPDTQLTLYEYPRLTLVWELRMWSKYPNQGGIDDSGTGTTFYGDQQVLNVTREGWKAFTKDEKKLIAQSHARDDKFLLHANNFIESMRSRRAPVADIASGHISAAVSLHGNVAYLAGEKIRYDPDKDEMDKREKDRRKGLAPRGNHDLRGFPSDRLLGRSTPERICSQEAIVWGEGHREVDPVGFALAGTCDDDGRTDRAGSSLVSGTGGRLCDRRAEARRGGVPVRGTDKTTTLIRRHRRGHPPSGRLVLRQSTPIFLPYTKTQQKRSDKHESRRFRFSATGPDELLSLRSPCGSDTFGHHSP